jgi:hypothetical protein
MILNVGLAKMEEKNNEIVSARRNFCERKQEEYSAREEAPSETNERQSP